jgi:hypothetical protein
MNKITLTKEIIQLIIEQRKFTVEIVDNGDEKSNHYILDNGNIYSGDGKLVGISHPTGLDYEDE